MSEPEGPYAGYADDMVFARRCPSCGRIVKADPSVTINGLGEYISKPNADCKRCGRVEMDFLGFIDEEGSKR